MKLKLRLERLDRIVLLIKRKATGSPQEFADKLSISKRTLYNELEVLKVYGARFAFCPERNSYHFISTVNLCFCPVGNSSRGVMPAL